MHKHKNVLKEIAKFAAGLIAADFLVGVWVFNAGITPIDFLGVNFTSSMISGWMIFDVILLAILVHYAWHADVHTPSISQKSLFVVVGLITGFIAVAHIFRVVFGVSVDIGGWLAPFWLSWVGIIVAAYVSYSSFRFASKR